LQDFLQPGTEIDASAPRGTFTLNTRDIFWIHGARDSAHLGFRGEIDSLLSSLPNCKRLIAFSRPFEQDILGKTYDLKGRLDIEAIQRLKVPKTADFYLCGPEEFMQMFRKDLETWGVWPELIHAESFGASTIALKTNVSRETPDTRGNQITLTRSNRVLNWTRINESILELAEAEQVPVQWSCRVGVCHACETSLLDGDIEYSPAPLDPPSSGRILICCARPKSDLVLDL
jgi:ferredoxin-NADP reductase